MNWQGYITYFYEDSIDFFFFNNKLYNDEFVVCGGKKINIWGSEKIN